MFRIRAWLLVVIIAIGVGAYLVVTNLGPGRKQPADQPQVLPEPKTAEKGETAPPGKSATEQPSQDMPDTAKAATASGATDSKDTCVIGGTVLDAEKKPVAAADVILLSGPCTDATAFKTRTDDGGRFRFDNAPRTNDHLVLKRPPIGAPWCLGKVDPSAKTPEELANLEFTLEGERTWTAVTKDKSSTPLAGVSVTLISNNSDGLDRRKCPEALSCSMQTDAQGRVVFNALESGHYGRIAQLEGFATVVQGHFCCHGEPQEKPLVITLARGGSICGLVLDPEGRPAKNASVTCHTQERYYGSLDMPTATTRCGTNGAFTLSDLPEGRYLLVASSDESSDGYLQRVRVVPGRERRDCTITLEPAREVQGRVLNTAKQPLEGVTVRLTRSLPDASRRRYYHSRDIEIEHLTTGADGSFRFKKAPTKGAEVAARKEGYESPRPTKVSGDEPITIVLVAGPIVTGVVTAAETGKPIEKATVYCLSEREEVETDAQGRYTFPGLSAGRQTFIAYAPDVATPSPLRALIKRKGTTELNFALEPSKPITGVVTDKTTGEPINEASVCAVGKKRTRRGPRYRHESLHDSFSSAAPFRTHTDEQGTFTIPISLPEMTAIKVAKSNYLEGRIELEGVDFARPLRIELERGAMISGQVLAPDGRPLKGARIGCERKHERTKKMYEEFYDDDFGSGHRRTDENGRFSVGGLPPGTYTLTATHEDFTAAAYDPVELAADQTFEGIEITLGSGGRISGVVTADDATPVEEATVHFAFELEEKEGATHRSTRMSERRRYHEHRSGEEVTTDLDGKYESGPLLPGTYNVSVRPEFHLPPEAQRVVVTAGVTVRDVNFVLKPAATISGRILDEEGNPIAEAEVSIWQFPGRRKATTGENGAFVLHGLQPGEVEFDIEAEGYLDKEHTCTAPAADVEITLDLGGKIIGRVVDKITQEPVEMFGVNRHHHRDHVYFRGGSRDIQHHPEGRFELSGLHFGTHGLQVITDNYAPATVKDIKVEKGAETQEVLVELVEGASLVLAVSSALDGRPVPEAAVSCHELQEAPEPTDTEGKCTIEHLAAGRYEFEIQHEEFATKERRVRLKEGEVRKEVKVALDKGLTVRGRVVTKDDQRPIEDATVFMNESGEEFWGYDPDDAEFRAETGPDGAFALEHVAPGRYRLIVQHPDYPLFKQKQRFKKSSNEELIIKLSAGGRIVGTVTDVGGTPQPEITVMIITFGSDADEVETDENGYYVIDRLTPGSYRLMLTPDEGFFEEGSTEVKRAVVRDGQDTRVDFVVGGGAAVFGTVRRGGLPLAGARLMTMAKGTSFLNLSGSVGSSITDEAGQYRIEELQPGTYTLYVTSAKVEWMTRHDFTIGEENLLLDIELGGGEIGGIVYDELGQPLEGATLSLMPEVKDSDRMAGLFSLFMMGRGSNSTDASGAFAILDVSPGSYRLYVQHEGYVTQLTAIEKEAGRDVPPLQFRLQKETAVTGCVRTPTGKLPDYLFVAVCDEKGRVLTGNNVAVDADTGEWKLGGTGPGKFVITAKASGYAPVSKEVTISGEQDTRVNLDLQAGRDLLVTVRNSVGKPVPGAAVVLDSGGDPVLTAALTFATLREEGDFENFSGTSETGAMNLRHVAEGEYTLRVNAEGYEPANVKIRIAGSDKKVTVTLKPAEAKGK